MKKLFISILITAALLLALAGVAFAANSEAIIEVPDYKIIMDGKLTEYNDVPLSVADRTLLPLRELLVNLGVPNDDAHIIYNDEEKSVTVYMDQMKIYLVVGNNVAYVNDQPIELDVAPVFYAKLNRTYIPLRFVSEALGKKVIWDGSANAILICDAAKYDSIKQILDRSGEAMKLVNKFKQTLNVDSTVESEQGNVKFNINVEAQVDKIQKKMYMKMAMDMALNMLSMEMKMDTYYTDNASYIQDILTQKWQKKTYLQPEYDKLFEDQSETITLDATEPLCAGLTQAEGTNPDEILLKGDVYLIELFKKALASQEAGNSIASNEDMGFDTFYIEISFNRNTYLITNIIMNVGLIQTTDQENTEMNVSVKGQFSDYNGDFQIIVPEDVLKNAVETQDAVK